MKLFRNLKVVDMYFRKVKVKVKITVSLIHMPKPRNFLEIQSQNHHFLDACHTVVGSIMMDGCFIQSR